MPGAKPIQNRPSLSLQTIILTAYGTPCRKLSLQNIALATHASFVCNAGLLIRNYSPMAESKKYQIAVSALPQFIADQSDPATERYVFAYTISIENVGTVPAQLISRHWVITDGNSKVQEVRGLGVIGQQPLLKPGEKFEYTSGCQLDTPVGTMRGTYQMTAEDGTQFEAVIAEFTLSIPRVLH